MDKPTVFNYRDYVNLCAEVDRLEEEVKELKREKANLEIALRIAREELEAQKND